MTEFFLFVDRLEFFLFVDRLQCSTSTRTARFNPTARTYSSVKSVDYTRGMFVGQTTKILYIYNIAGLYFLVSNKNYDQRVIKDLSKFYSNNIDPKCIEQR